MSEKKRFTASFGREVLSVIKWGILFGCAICILESVVNISRLMVIYLPIPYIWYLGRLIAWPLGMIPGFILALLRTFFHHTVVEIDKKQVCIRRPGKKYVLPIGRYANSSVNKKSFSVSALQFTILKVYLLFYEQHGTKAYRLYTFTEKDLEKVIKEIRVQHAAGMETEEKVHLQEQFDAPVDGAPENVFDLSSEKLIAAEKRTIKKIALLELGLAAVLLLLLLGDVFTDGGWNWELPLVLAVLILMLLALPLRIAALGRKKSKCAERIALDSSHIWIGGSCYSFLSISAICMTSPRENNGSVMPAQYYMTITQNKERRKYWLGSQVSFGGYAGMCRKLEKAMIMYPGKLSYKR